MNHCRFFQLTTKYKWFLQEGRWIRLYKYWDENSASFKQTKFGSTWFSLCCKKQKQRKQLMMVIGLKFWSHIMLIKINKGSLFASEMKLSVVWTIVTYENGLVPILFLKSLSRHCPEIVFFTEFSISSTTSMFVLNIILWYRLFQIGTVNIHEASGFQLGACQSHCHFKYVCTNPKSTALTQYVHQTFKQIRLP